MKEVNCTVSLGILGGVQIGVTWRIRLNHPYAAAMRPYVKLLWLCPLVDIAADTMTDPVNIECVRNRRLDAMCPYVVLLLVSGAYSRSFCEWTVVQLWLCDNFIMVALWQIGGVPLWGGELSPHLTLCSQGRGVPACQVSSWSVQPFGHSARTLQTDRLDRQIDRQDRQLTDSIGRTVLQRSPKNWSRTISASGSHSLPVVLVL